MVSSFGNHSLNNEFVDVPLIFDGPADHVPDRQPRVILLGMVEARSVNVNISFRMVFFYPVTTGWIFLHRLM